MITGEEHCNSVHQMQTDVKHEKNY